MSIDSSKTYVLSDDARTLSTCVKVDSSASHGDKDVLISFLRPKEVEVGDDPIGDGTFVEVYSSFTGVIVGPNGLCLVRKGIDFLYFP